MKSCTLVSLVAAAVGVAAVPAIHDIQAPAKDIENVNVKDLLVQKTNGQITHVSFKIDARKATDLLCEASNPVVKPFGQAPGIYNCVNEESKYRFSLLPGTSDYDITLHMYHELGPAIGFQGEAVVPFNCHGVGNTNNLNCGQISTVYTIPIWFQ